MAKDKITVTVDPQILADADADARHDGLSRSQYVETVLQDAHYRRLLAAAHPAELPATEQQHLRNLLAWQRNPGTADAA